MSGRGGGSGRRGRSTTGSRGYPRAARVNEVLRQVLAEELERIEDIDERLGMLTITAVHCDPDLRHATVLLSSLGDTEAEALAAVRVRLQAAISHEVRLKRTPQLSFAADPAVASGQRIEEILSRIQPVPDSGAEVAATTGPSGGAHPGPGAPPGAGAGADGDGGPAGEGR